MSIMTDGSTVYYNFGIGPLPFLSFGLLSLSETELSFEPDALPWTPSWGRVGIQRIVKAEAMTQRNGLRRRLVWVLGILLFPIPGLLGLPWLARFWHRADASTLEVTVKRFRFTRTRVYIVDNPEQWAESINGLIERDRSALT